MKAIASVIYRRLLQSIPVVAGVVALLFVLLTLAPGDLVDVMGAEAGIDDERVLAKLRSDYGLDRPWYGQLAMYLWNVAHLDLGYSARDARPVLEMIAERIPATLILMGTAAVIAAVVGITLGMIAALRVNTRTDNAISVFTLTFFAAPSFWVGSMFIVLFSVKLGWLPVSGMETLGADHGAFGRIIDIARHLIMPAVALGLFYAAIYARVMRASMLEVHGADFIQTARAKGETEGGITFHHVLRNAVLPVVTLGGMQLGTMLAGSVVMENVFNWPGIGTLLFDSVQARNMPVVLGILLISSVIVVVANLLVDLLYLWIDPRIEY